MKSDTYYLRRAMKLAAESRASGNHPFRGASGRAGWIRAASSGNTYAQDRGVSHAGVERGARRYTTL